MTPKKEDAMFNCWVILYHRYSRKAWYDKAAVRRFAKDCRRAQKMNIGLVEIEGYYHNYPEYLSFWSWKTLKEFIHVAHDHGMKVLPYASPTTMDISSDFYKFHGEQCCVRIISPVGKPMKVWAWRSYPDGEPYWQDYRGEAPNWVYADPCTGWKDYYLETCEGLLDFGFDGIFIDQYQEPTASCDHPDINEQTMDMLRKMKAMVKSANKENVILANIMAAKPVGKAGREFVRRTKIADYVASESADTDISGDVATWSDILKKPIFLASHGTYESHKRKLAIARKLKYPFCLFIPTPFDKADPRILKLYESQ